MKAPVTLVFLRSVERLNRRWRIAERARIEAVMERDDALELVTDLRDDVAGWRRRAEVLYEIADPELRDGVLGVIDTIERMPEVQS